ncbi:outer membrane protein [Brucella sp. TWI559]
MSFKKFAGASLFAIMTASAAHAADAITSQEPVPMASVFSWGGAYVGGEIGWGWAKSKVSAWDFADSSENLNSNGFLGGVYAGYNFDMGNNVILGLEGNFNYNDLKKSNDYAFKNTLSYTTKSQLEWSGALRARAGYAIDRFMPYIAGGLAFGNIKTSYADSARDFSNSKTKTGWTIGAGVDYAATNNVILRLEYRYTDFGKDNFDFGDTAMRNSVKTNDIRIGVAYKF